MRAIEMAGAKVTIAKHGSDYFLGLMDRKGWTSRRGRELAAETLTGDPLALDRLSALVATALAAIEDRGGTVRHLGLAPLAVDVVVWITYRAPVGRGPPPPSSPYKSVAVRRFSATGLTTGGCT